MHFQVNIIIVFPLSYLSNTQVTVEKKWILFFIWYSVVSVSVIVSLFVY